MQRYSRVHDPSRARRYKPLAFARNASSGRPTHDDFNRKVERRPRSVQPQVRIALATYPKCGVRSLIDRLTRQHMTRRVGARANRGMPRYTRANSHPGAPPSRYRRPARPIRKTVSENQLGLGRKSARVPERHRCVGRRVSAPLRVMEVNVTIPLWESSRATVVCFFITFPVTNSCRPNFVRPPTQGLNLFIDLTAYFYYHRPLPYTRKSASQREQRFAY